MAATIIIKMENTNNVLILNNPINLIFEEW